MDNLGILVFGQRRPFHLRAVLESLKLQNALKLAHIWVDGYSGNPEIMDEVFACRGLKVKFPEANWTFFNSRLGIDRLMLDGLEYMSKRYKYILILEDDCLPTLDSVDQFRAELKEIEMDPSIFSVYGHPFLVEGEKTLFSRFQGWGWATTSSKAILFIRKLRELFNMLEADYLALVESMLTPKILSRLDVTPGRDVVATLRWRYSWDSTLALLTAFNTMSHKKSGNRIVYNCGIGQSSGHFSSNDLKFRYPPFNMLDLDEAKKKVFGKTLV